MNKVQRLRNYFNGLPTLQDKIRAIQNIYLLQNLQGYFDADEKAEFERICVEFFYPTKTEGGREIPDIDKYCEHAAALQKMSVEAKDYTADAARRFYVEALDEKGEVIAEEETFNSDGDKEIKIEDRNWMMAVMKTNQLPEFGIPVMIRNSSTDYAMKYDKKSKLFENELLKRGDFKEYLKNEAKKAALMANAEYSDDYVRNYIKRLGDGEIENQFREFLYQQEMIQKNQDKISHIDSISKMDFNRKNCEKSGLDYNQLNAVLDYGTNEELAGFGKPWEEDIKKKNGIYIRQISKVGPAGNLTQDDLISRMGQISQLYAHMQRTMGSIFRDGDEYKKMTAAMRKVSEIYGDGNVENLKRGNNIDRCRKAMKDVLQTAGNYIDSHSTNRSFTKGKNRFEAAIAAAAIVNENAASGITEKVNEIRRTKDNTQLVDLRTVAQHLPMARFRNPEIREELQTLKAKNKNPLSQEEYLNLKDTAISRSSRKFLSDKKTGTGKTELDKSARLAAIEPIIGSPERAGSMILSYAKWKHPEYADMKASKILYDNDSSNVGGEFAKFLEENAVYKEDGRTLLSDDKVRTSMKNLAEFRSDFVKSIKNNKIPDYSKQDVRSTCFEETADLKGQVVEFYQNYKALENVNLEKKDGGVFFFDVYPDGMDGCFKDDDFLTNYGYYLQCAVNIDDPKAMLGKRVASKLITDRISHELGDRTAEEYFTSEEGKKCIREAMAIDAIFAGVNMEEKLNAEKKACMDYISGNGPMPDIVWKRMQKEEKTIIEHEALVRNTSEMQRKEKKQKYLAGKGAGPVQKTSFSDLQEDMKEEKKQEQPKNSSRSQIKQEPEEEEIFKTEFKRKKSK